MKAYILPMMLMTACGTDLAQMVAEQETKTESKPCTVTDTEVGAKISCPDGSTAEIQDGEQGVSGKAGKDGKEGKDGKDGAKGDQGDKGKDGSKGEQGVAGAKGETGSAGATGAAGTNGTNGTNGSDAYTLRMYTKNSELMGNVISVDDLNRAAVQLPNKAILSIPYGSSVVVRSGSTSIFYASSDCSGSGRFVYTNNSASNLFYDDIRNVWLKAKKGTPSAFTYNSRLTEGGSCTVTSGSVSTALEVETIDMSAYATWFDYTVTGQPAFTGAPFQIIPE